MALLNLTIYDNALLAILFVSRSLFMTSNENSDLL